MEKQVYRPIFSKINVKKAIIFALIAGMIGVIFLSITTVSQNEDTEEPPAKEAGNTEDLTEPQGRNFSVQLDEKMGFSAP